MMKRWSIFLFCMLLLGLTACGDAGTVSTSTQLPEPSSQQPAPSSSESSESNAPSEVSVPTESELENTPAESSGVLVAYFSCTGNTAPIAADIAELTGADLFEIVPAVPYTDADLSYNNDDCRANKEQNDKDCRPEIQNDVESMANYTLVYLGFPIWWSEEPRIIDTFLESYDFAGKTIVPFCTSGGSGISGAETSLQTIVPETVDWLEGKRFAPRTSMDEVQSWIESLNLTE